MKKVAFINFGDPGNMKGMMINVHEKAKQLNQKKTINMHFTFYLLQFKDSTSFSFLKPRKHHYSKTTIIDGINYINIFIRRTLFDYITTFKLKQKGIIAQKYYERKIQQFQNYDLILSHGYESNYLAYRINKAYNIPYIASWHGSDINIYPYSNIKSFQIIKNIIEFAKLNHFVSKKLLNKSNDITTNGVKKTLYTGVSPLFYNRSDIEISHLRKLYNPSSHKIIAYIGNLKSVKNVLSLPLILKMISNHNFPFKFWIIGDGILKLQLLKRLESYKIDYVYYGDISNVKVAELMSCIDVLVLPSKDEGMPRVIIEALSSGVNVVASDVGGIPEILDKNNYFKHDQYFIENISTRILEILSSDESPQPLDYKFKWEFIIKNLVDCYYSSSKSHKN